MSRAGSFSFQLSRATEAIKEEIVQKQNRIILKLFSAFVMDSPVDKGSFRGSWFVSYGSPDLEQKYDAPENGISKSAATQMSIDRMVGFLAGFNDGVMWITNNQSYAQRLEYGWSKQAPQGMVRRNIARFNEIAKRA